MEEYKPTCEQRVDKLAGEEVLTPEQILENYSIKDGGESKSAWANGPTPQPPFSNWNNWPHKR